MCLPPLEECDSLIKHHMSQHLLILRAGLWACSLVAIWGPSATASALSEPSFTYADNPPTFTKGVDLNSDIEWVQDYDRTPPTSGRYSPQLDQRLMILAPPGYRAATVAFDSGDLFSSDEDDKIELGWYGSSASVRESGVTRPLDSMTVPAASGKSLMQPGLRFRFATGAPASTQGGGSEADGFDMDSITFTGGNLVYPSTLRTVAPFERVIIGLTLL
jgi:hypothetical protein